MKTLLTILSFSATLALFAEKMPFERYQSIIDRQPFGAPPPGFNPEQMASDVSKDAYADSGKELTPEQAEIQKNVSFNIINLDPDTRETMVGFADRSDPKLPRRYYLAVGQSQDGWKVKEADAIKKTMTVVKEGVEVTLELGANSNAKGKGGPAAAAPGARAPGRTGMLSGLRASSAAAPTASAAQGGSASPAPGGRSGLLNRRGGAFGGVAGERPMSSFQGRRARREQEAAEAKAQEEARDAERKRQAEEAAARQEEEKAAREKERAEQREQLMAIQEELRRAREEKARMKAEAAAAESGEGGDGNNEP